MSRKGGEVLPVVEWSPAHAQAVGASGVLAEGTSLASISGHLGSRRAIVALSRRSAFVRSLRVPNASLREVRQALRVQVGQLFPIAQDSLAFDVRLTDDVSAEGRLAIVCAASESVLTRLDADLDAAGVQAAAVFPVCFGSPFIARSLGLSSAAVVERTPEGIAIDIVHGGELRASRLIPATQVQSEIESEVCRSFAAAGLPCSSIITAGGFELSGADFRARQGALDALASDDVQRIGLHLVLPEVAARRERTQAANRARLAVLIAGATVLLGALAAMDRLDAAAAVRRDEAKWEAQLRRLRSARDAARSAASAASSLAAPLKAAFEPAQQASDVVALAGNLTPQGVWMTGTTFERGKPFQIRGTAVANEAITAYVDSLGAQNRFRDVRLAFASNAMIEDTSVVNFSITAHVIGNLPLADPKAVRPK